MHDDTPFETLINLVWDIAAGAALILFTAVALLWAEIVAALRADAADGLTLADAGPELLVGAKIVIVAAVVIGVTLAWVRWLDRRAERARAAPAAAAFTALEKLRRRIGLVPTDPDWSGDNAEAGDYPIGGHE